MHFTYYILAKVVNSLVKHFFQENGFCLKKLHPLSINEYQCMCIHHFLYSINWHDQE